MLRVSPRAWGSSLPEAQSLFDVRAAAVEAVSSLFPQETNRTFRLQVRTVQNAASSITSAVPDPSSFAASPQPARPYAH